MPVAARLLAALVALAALPAAEPWTGRIEIAEIVAAAERNGDQRELERLAGTLEDRAGKLRERLRTATPTVARTLRSDLAHLQGEMEQLAIQRGGSVTLGATIYVVGPTRTLVDGDEARVVVDRARGVAMVTAAGREEAVRVPPAPEPRALEDPEPADDAFGAEARRGRLKTEDGEYVVTLAAGLPNPYAHSLLPATRRDALHAALAALPGLPVEVERRHGDVVRRWRVRVCEPGPVDESNW